MMSKNVGQDLIQYFCRSDHKEASTKAMDELGS